MASVDKRVLRTGTTWRCRWSHPQRGAQCTSWPLETLALRAKELVEAYRGAITRDQIHKIIVGTSDEPIHSDAPLLGEWMETYLDSKTSITTGTLSGYRADYRNHIHEPFGSKHLDQIQPSEVGKWVNGLRERGYKQTSITRYFTLLDGCLAAAMRQRPPLITENPCKLADFRRDQVEEDDEGAEGAVYLTRTEVDIAVNNFPAYWRPLAAFVFDTGLRFGELSALAIEHLTPPNSGDPAGQPRVSVRRAWKRGGPGKGRYLGTTKGRSRRDLVFRREVWDMLQPCLLNAQGARRRKTDFLFITPSGTPLDHTNFYRQVWQPAIQRAMHCGQHPPADRGARVPRRDGRRCGETGQLNGRGQPCGSRVVPGWDRCVRHRGPDPDVPSDCECPGVLRKRPGIHDARHTHASILLSSGVSLLAVQRRLGHKRASTTSEVYGGLHPEEVEQGVLAALRGPKG